MGWWGGIWLVFKGTFLFQKSHGDSVDLQNKARKAGSRKLKKENIHITILQKEERKMTSCPPFLHGACK